MNSNLKKLLIPAALVGTALTYWSFNLSPSFNISGPVNNPVLNQMEYFIGTNAGSLPTPAPYTDLNGKVTPASEDFDNWRVLATFSDGTFWMGSKYNFDHTGFPFLATGSNITASVEMAPTYDDGNTNPGRVYSYFPVNQSVSNAPGQRKVNLSSSAPYVLLQSSLSPRNGSILTFIITYQNPNPTTIAGGHLDFYFDPSVLQYNNNECEVYEGDRSLRGGSIPASTVTVGSNNYSRIQVPFTNLVQNEQRNVFVRCTTATNVDPSTAYLTPWVDMIQDISGTETRNLGSSAMSSQRVVDVHDPNHKWAVQQQLCMNASTVDFMVTFQNDGPDVVDDIVVTDELHWLLKNQAPQLLPPVPANLATPSLDASTRQVKFTFTNAHVHGLREAGLGTLFTEADTRRTFAFRCELDPLKTNGAPCNAILNSASIQFNCNPVIHTDVAMAPLRCTDCDSCQVLSRDTIVLDTIHPENGLPLTGVLHNWLNDHGYEAPQTHYVWYPSSDLTDPSQLYTTFNNSQTLYPYHTLVASGSSPCQRRILHLALGHAPCDLGINIDASQLSVTCNGVVSGTITATATGAFNASSLTWNNCAQGVNSITVQTQSDKLEYYFSITDSQSGCSKELVYVVKIPPCNPGGGSTGTSGVIWTVLSAAIAAILALSWWLRNKIVGRKR